MNCVLIISGMYVAHTYWTRKGIGMAQSYSKPIVGIRPRGPERVPQALGSVAKEMVGWNAESIVLAIRKRAVTPRSPCPCWLFISYRLPALERQCWPIQAHPAEEALRNRGEHQGVEIPPPEWRNQP